MNDSVIYLADHMGVDMDGTARPIRIVAASGLFLDRAWPDLGVECGKRMRGASEEALLRIVRHVEQSEADVLVLLGDLFEQRCITPGTLETLRLGLERVGVPVLIVPGREDWYDERGLFATVEWPSNVHVFRSSELTPHAIPAGPTFWARAQCEPGSRPLRTADVPASLQGTGPHVWLLQAEFGDAEESMPNVEPLSRGPFQHVILPIAPRGQDTPHISETGLVMGAPVGESRSGQAVLIEFDPAGARLDRTVVEVGMAVGAVVLDVTGIDSSRELLQRIEELDSTGPIELMGRLSRGVLLPTSAGLEVDRPIATTRMTYDLPPPEEHEQTASAEFERLVLETDAPDQDRHQAIALGLESLSQTGEAPS